MTSLCFLKAWTRTKDSENALSEKEACNQMLEHLRGIRHPEDENKSNGIPLAKFCPWAGALRHIALYTDYEPLKGKI
jgi:hypothetical protein